MISMQLGAIEVQKSDTFGTTPRAFGHGECNLGQKRYKGVTPSVQLQNAHKGECKSVPLRYKRVSPLVQLPDLSLARIGRRSRPRIFLWPWQITTRPPSAGPKSGIVCQMRHTSTPHAPLGATARRCRAKTSRPNNRLPALHEHSSGALRV